MLKLKNYSWNFVSSQDGPQHAQGSNTFTLPLGELVVSECTATNSYADSPPTKRVFKHCVYPQRDSSWQAVVSVEQWCGQKVLKGYASVLSAAIKTPYMQLIQSLECNRLNALQHCRLSTPIQGICLQCLAEQPSLSSNSCQFYKLYIYCIIKTRASSA